MTIEGKAHVDPAHPDREIEEDVMNVGFVSWIGAVTTILIIASVFVLTGVYYLTKDLQMQERQAQADDRLGVLEAQRTVDGMVVDGVYKLPDVEDADGNVTRGGYSVPVTRGMQQVVQQNGN